MSARVSSVVGFLLAGFVAPPASVALFVLLSGITGITLGGAPLGSDWILACLIASYLGTIPSLLFGGLTLLAMRTVFRPWPPRRPVLVAGGLAAAASYCLAFELAGMAPWDARVQDDPSATVLIVIAILLSGVVAGLIYAAFARRG